MTAAVLFKCGYSISLCQRPFFPGGHGLASFIGAKDDGSGVDNCKALIKPQPGFLCQKT